jgi:hypothetical protein
MFAARDWLTREVLKCFPQLSSLFTFDWLKVTVLVLCSATGTRLNSQKDSFHR